MIANQEHGFDRVITKPLHEESGELNTCYDGTGIWECIGGTDDTPVCSPENPLWSLIDLQPTATLAHSNEVKLYADLFRCHPKTRETYRTDQQEGEWLITILYI